VAVAVAAVAVVALHRCHPLAGDGRPIATLRPFAGCIYMRAAVSR